MASERKVTVQRSEANMIDQDFSAIRSRFEDEMKKMEDEMNRFRSHLMDREVGFFGPSSGLSQPQHQQTQHSSLTSDIHQRSTSPNWVDNINSPLVHDTDDGKVLRLKFDVTQYAPEEIVVKTIDNRLQVSILLPILCPLSSLPTALWRIFLEESLIESFIAFF